MNPQGVDSKGGGSNVHVTVLVDMCATRSQYPLRWTHPVYTGEVLLFLSLLRPSTVHALQQHNRCVLSVARWLPDLPVPLLCGLLRVPVRSSAHRES